MRHRIESRRLAAALALAGLLVAGCGGPVRRYACRAPADAAVVPQALVACHREIVARVVRGKPFGLAEYREAARFFERLTGLPAGSHETPLGPVPSEGLDEALGRWEAWLAVHGERLIWDAAEGTLVLGPQP